MGAYLSEPNLNKISNDNGNDNISKEDAITEDTDAKVDNAPSVLPALFHTIFILSGLSFKFNCSNFPSSIRSQYSNP